MNAKKILKSIGNIVTIIAIIFIITRLLQSDFDYSQLLENKNIFPTIIITLVQAIIVVTNTYPWKKLVELLARVKLPYFDTIVVYVKANLMKYVPGNVFQYVGRNDLAVRRNIPHLKVATATILDVGMTVLSAFLISLFFLYNYIIEFFKTINAPTFIWLLILIIIIAFIVLLLIFKDKINIKLKKYRYLVSKESIITLSKCLIYYIFVMLLSSLMYMIVIIFILDVRIDNELFFKLFSAYTLSWLVGFITPGAPAGIGIKEAVMVSVTGGTIDTAVVALSMVILRILATLADGLAFLVVLCFGKMKNKIGDKDNVS